MMNNISIGLSKYNIEMKINYILSFFVLSVERVSMNVELVCIDIEY